jgi:hypothetical protein
MLFLGFVLGFGSAWLWIHRPSVDMEVTEEETTQEETGTTNQEVVGQENTGSIPDSNQPSEVVAVGTVSDEVLVKDQVVGMEVFITRVALTQDGWVAVQETLPNGDLGNILGAKRFDAGVAQGTVNLLRATTAGNTYAVTLWNDNGDGAFDHTSDAQLVDATGKALGMSFQAYGTTSE